MGMVGMLLNSAEPFAVIVNTPSTGLMWNLVKIGHAISEKITQFYTCI